MLNKQEMMLESPSGYMMPFASDIENDGGVQITLNYGDQTHPMTGEQFVHHGIDFVANHVPLYAVASGSIVGIGNDPVHGNYIVSRYGKYEVKYGHVSEVYAGYGAAVVAGQPIAQSGDFLHLGVRFEGEEINPIDFVTMLLINVQQLEAMGIKNYPNSPLFGVQPNTGYNDNLEEIVTMMMRYLPLYLQDLTMGNYEVPQRIQNSLRNVFSQAAQKNYFFEEIPNMANPLGLGQRAVPLAGKVQKHIIDDFLNYMGLKHDMYLSSWTEAQKKNFLKELSPTVS